MEDDLQDAFYLWEKGAAFGHVLLFSIPVLNPRAWFSGKPVTQLGKKKNFKNKKIKKYLLVVSYRKKKNTKTPTFSTDTTYCSVKEFSLPKKRKKTKKTLKAGVDILLSDAFY